MQLQLRVKLKLITCFFFLTISSSAYAQVDDINQELKKLIDSIISGGKSKVKTEGCTLQKERWATILLTKEPFVENIKFNKTCDLQGKFTVKADQFFPVKLQIRNLENYQGIMGEMKFQLVFSSEADLKVELNNSTLTGKKPIHFKMHYTASIDPMNPKDLIRKRKGGELILTAKNHKTIIKKYPIK